MQDANGLIRNLVSICKACKGFFKEATEEASAEVLNEPGDIVYDLGFTPEANGFSFSNYGGETPATNLTAAELSRMFGDQVCARLDGDEVIDEEYVVDDAQQ